MKISACIIVKNESANIEACIKSARLIADDIFVVDTGSTDDTVEKAKAMGANVSYFEWIDDFAAAKNFAIEKAGGDWIFFPDADEYIDDETAALILAEIKKNHHNKNVDALTGYLYNIDQKTGNVLKAAPITRIFRRDPNVRYEGRIHEKIIHKKRHMNQVVIERMKIYHTGYTSELLPQKHERNLQMLLKVEKEGMQDPTNLFHIAGTLFVLERYEEAMAYIEKFEANPQYDFLSKHFSLMPNFFTIKVLAMLKLEGRYTYKDMMKAVDKGIALYPDSYDIYEQKINIALQFEEYELALVLYENIIALYDNSEKTTGYNHKRDRSRMYTGMASIYMKADDINNAFDYYLKAVIEDYTFEVAVAGLLKTMKDQPIEDIAAFLGQIYDESIEEQMGFLTFVAQSIDMREVFSYYFKKLRPDNTERYLRYKAYSEGNYEAGGSLS